jgi:hypothetical protein
MPTFLVPLCRGFDHDGIVWLLGSGKVKVKVTVNFTLEQYTKSRTRSRYIALIFL